MNDQANNILPIEDNLSRRSEERARLIYEARLQTMTQTLEFSPLGMLWMNEDLKIVSSNQRFAALLSVSAERLTGRSLWECLPNLPRQAVLKAIFEKSTYVLEHYRVPHDNHEFERHFDISIWPLIDSEGMVRGAMLSAADQTSRVRQVQEREDLMFTLAHDLKVPHIGADRMFELLLENSFGNLSTDQKRVVSMMRQSNQDVLSMLHNLLYLYRTEQDAEGFNLQPFDLGKLIRKCVAEMEPLSHHKVLKIEVNVPADLPHLNADPNAIRRVITNLLHNAIKFTPDTGHIKISGSKTSKSIYFEVEDSGQGISKEDHKKLFKRFWQGNSKRHGPGNGLGLYVCRKIIEAHKGTISVDSHPGISTVFRVELPR